ncbi:transposase [Streptomyces shenzhenensis]|uniref:transposase n=1 Tax=Streptomyces shenzhenensis TaxID=943815 RepID=UPI0033F92F22
MLRPRCTLFELADAVLYPPGAMYSAVELTLLPEHRRGHGGMHDVPNQDRIGTGRLRQVLAGLPLSRFPDGRLVPTVDVSPWLRSPRPWTWQNGRSSLVGSLASRRCAWIRAVCSSRST